MTTIDRVVSRHTTRQRIRKWGLIALILVIFGVIIAFFSGPTLTKADGGTVIVVREGGWFDDTSVRDVVQPNSGNTWEGWHSTEHPYPASQRFFRVGPEGTADSQESVNILTKDGVTISVEGTWYFTLTTNKEALSGFDDRFGTRTFNTSDGPRYAWEQPEGWSAFLDSTFSTTAQNASRLAISGSTCAELIPSCILVQGQSAAIDVPKEQLDAAAAASTNALTAMQETMRATFQTEANQILGDGVLTVQQFSLSRLTLPQSMQDSITNALNTRTDSNAKIIAAQATEEQAKAEARANTARQDGYNACPVCGEIDLRKAIPPTVTIWAPGGSGLSVAAPAPAAAPAG